MNILGSYKQNDILGFEDLKEYLDQWNSENDEKDKKEEKEEKIIQRKN